MVAFPLRVSRVMAPLCSTMRCHRSGCQTRHGGLPAVKEWLLTGVIWNSPVSVASNSFPRSVEAIGQPDV